MVYMIDKEGRKIPDNLQKRTNHIHWSFINNMTLNSN